MPSSKRKKRANKQRKAARMEVRSKSSSGTTRGESSDGKKKLYFDPKTQWINDCNHGIPQLRPEDSILFYDFLNSYVVFPMTNAKFVELFEQLYNRFSLKSSETIEKLESIVLSKATEILLTSEQEEWEESHFLSLLSSLVKIVSKTDDRDIARYFESMQKHIVRGRRGVTRFLAKRIPCSCLKAYNQNAKTESKVLACTFCRTETESQFLKTCKGCKLAVYCNAKCQAADWGRHKKCCRIMQLAYATVGSGQNTFDSEQCYLASSQVDNRSTFNSTTTNPSAVAYRVHT